LVQVVEIAFKALVVFMKRIGKELAIYDRFIAQFLDF
jgi:hypothetical protein